MLRGKSTSYLLLFSIFLLTLFSSIHFTNRKDIESEVPKTVEEQVIANVREAEYEAAIDLENIKNRYGSGEQKDGLINELERVREEINYAYENNDHLISEDVSKLNEEFDQIKIAMTNDSDEVALRIEKLSEKIG